MIDAQELRIGNLVKSIPNEKIYPVSIKTLRLLQSGKLNYIEPIPITNEWLTLKFGATEYAEGRFYLEINNKLKLAFNLGEDFFICELFSNSHHFCYLNDMIFVHQLQNLYFALTGKELEPKE